MSTALVPTPGSALAHAVQRFAHWRRTRQHRSPIPETLWGTAVATARTQGVNKTARTLRLNHDALKKRLEAATRPPAPAPFVELLPAAPAPSYHCQVELERPTGARLRIQLTSPSPPDLAALTQSFWHGAP